MKENPNLSYIENIAKGNTLFTQKLIGIIKKELSGEVETYHFNLSNGYLNKTAKDVHKLSHKVRILGLENGHQIAEKYSTDLLENNLSLRLDFEGILTSMLLFIKKV